MSLKSLVQYDADSFTGTGAAVSIPLNFKPRFILAYDETDGTTYWFWIDGMADGKCMQDASGTISFLASNGITVSPGAISFGSSVSLSGKLIRFVAI